MSAGSRSLLISERLLPTRPSQNVLPRQVRSSVGARLRNSPPPSKNSGPGFPPLSGASGSHRSEFIVIGPVADVHIRKCRHSSCRCTLTPHPFVLSRRRGQDKKRRGP